MHVLCSGRRIILGLGLVLSLVVSMIACKSEEIVEYDEQKYVNLLIDLYVSEAFLTKQNINLRDSLGNVYKEQLARMHGYSIYELDSVLIELRSHDDLFEKVERKVIDSLKTLNNSK